MLLTESILEVKRNFQMTKIRVYNEIIISSQFSGWAITTMMIMMRCTSQSRSQTLKGCMRSVTMGKTRLKRREKYYSMSMAKRITRPNKDKKTTTLKK